MTDDEQEALSFRYVMPRVMRLSSGRFAVFTGQHLDKLTIVQGVDLPFTIPFSNEIEIAQVERASRSKSPGPLKTLNLADLGL